MLVIDMIDNHYKGKIYKEQISVLKNKYKNDKYFLKFLNRFIIRFYLSNFFKANTELNKNLKKKYSIKSYKDFYNNKKHLFRNKVLDKFGFDDEFNECDKNFSEQLYKSILKSNTVQVSDGRADLIIRKLFKAFLTNPQQLPDNTIISFIRNLDEKTFLDKLHWEKNSQIKKLVSTFREILDTEINKLSKIHSKRVLLRTVCDFVSGMTDHYAIKFYHDLYGINW